MLKLLLLLAPAVAFAQSLGGVADRVLGPVSSLSHIIYMACYIIGAGLLIASVFQYFQYRSNPQHVRLSQPVRLFILGAIVVCIPLIAHFSTSAV